MSDILQAYKDLSSSSPRNEVSKVFNSIANAPIFTFDAESRTELLKLILQDLLKPGSDTRLTSKDAAHALLAVKTLGKDPSGSSFLSTKTNLSALLRLSVNLKDNHEASCEALRCIANALLLIEDARSTFISKEVNGGDACVMMLEKANTPNQIYILSRILFLSTASGPSYLESLVDEKHNGHTIIEILGSKLDLLTVATRNSVPFAKEGLTDTLKFIFNLLLHYPKASDSEPQHADIHDDRVIGDFWHAKLDGILSPLLRTFADLPATSPSPIMAPLTHVIHALISIPINATLKPIWLGTTMSTRQADLQTPKHRTPRDSSPGSRSESPPRSHPTSPILSTLDRALSSVISASRKSMSRTPSNGPTIDVFQRAYDLLDQSFLHYFPGDIDVDDASVRQRARAANDILDDTLSPLVVLITRFCVGDEGLKARERQLLLPEDLDRSFPLESRPDLLGRCLRLLSSVYHPRLKEAVGELLFAIADSNATTLCALVGYGNVAGLLFNKGLFSAPPSDTGPSNAPLTTPTGASINPITGIVEQKKEPLPEMSEEEKEREMDKLLVLFDRLEKSGALPPDQNPIRKGIQSGKLRSVD